MVLKLYRGLDERGWGVTEDFSLPFAISGDGERRIHTVDISAAPDCFVAFALRFGNEGHIKIYNLSIEQ